MLRKIDCVMIRVDDVKAAMAYYSDVFGLRPVWWDERSAGLVFPGSGAEIVGYCNPDIPSRGEVYYLVDDVVSAVQNPATHAGKKIFGPFDITKREGAGIENPFGTRLC